MSNLNFHSAFSATAGPGNTNFIPPTPAEASLIGLRLGLPVSALQKILRGTAGSDGNNGHGEHTSEPAQRPEDHLVGLGLGLPTDEMHSSFRDQPKIGLGIYISGWEVVDDREDEDRDDGEAAPLPSPPLLPIRRVSPFHVDVIIDDDEFPPTHSIFTPPMPESTEGEEYPFRRTFIRPPFMCAPSASELPNPYLFNYAQASQEPSQSSHEADQPYDANVASSSDEDEDDAEPFIEPGSPRTPFVFQPFTPTSEGDSGCASPFTGRREEECNEPALIRPPAFMPHVLNVFSPARLPSTEAEAYFHLPSNLFVSPSPAANRCKDFGTLYETTALCF